MSETLKTLKAQSKIRKKLLAKTVNLLNNLFQNLGCICFLKLLFAARIF